MCHLLPKGGCLLLSRQSRIPNVSVLSHLPVAWCRALRDWNPGQIHPDGKKVHRKHLEHGKSQESRSRGHVSAMDTLREERGHRDRKWRFCILFRSAWANAKDTGSSWSLGRIWTPWQCRHRSLRSHSCIWCQWGGLEGRGSRKRRTQAAMLSILFFLRYW